MHKQGSVEKSQSVIPNLSSRKDLDEKRKERILSDIGYYTNQNQKIKAILTSSDDEKMVTEIGGMRVNFSSGDKMPKTSEEKQEIEHPVSEI